MRTTPLLRIAGLRCFTDVRDDLCACRMAADRDHAGQVFHVCTGRETAISEVLDLLHAMSQCEISIEIDGDRVRRSDIPWMVGNPSRIETAIGWCAEIPLEQTLRDLLNWWREREREQ